MVETGSIADAIVAIATLILAAAAVGATIAAFSGLNTWKHQTKWQSDFELSKALLVGIMKRRDAVQHIRSPFGWSSETELEDKEIPKDEVKWRGLQQKYQNRYEKLSSVRQASYAQKLEATAIWRKEFSELEGELARLEGELLTEIEEYIESFSPRNCDEAYFSSREERNKNRRVVSNTGGPKDDFGTRYDEAWRKLEKQLLAKFNG